MSRDQWAERTARDLIQSTWRPGEDATERRLRVIAETAADIERLETQRQEEQEDLEVLAELVVEKLSIEREIAARRLAAANQILAAAKERRALDRSTRRAETRARRAAEGPREDVISCHVKVDPSAWTVLGQETRRVRTTLSLVVGAALTEEVAKCTAGEVSGTPSSRRRRSPGEDSPSPTDRVIRVAIDLETWAGINEAAAATGLTAGRYAGEVIEGTAHRFGWRAGQG